MKLNIMLAYIVVTGESGFILILFNFMKIIRRILIVVANSTVCFHKIQRCRVIV